MAWIQTTSPPSPETGYFSVSDFSGGLNNVDSYMEIANNESINLLNADIFREQGVVWQRGGTEYYDATDLTDPITLLETHFKDTPALIRATDDEIYSNTTKLADTNGRSQGTSFQKKFVFVDGGGIFVVGTFPQTGGTYITITGTPVATEIVMELKGEEASYTPLDATHDIGVTVYDYTNGYIYYNPCQNEIDDTYKGANFVPTTPTCIANKEGRLFIAGDDDLPYSVFISDIQNPYYFPVGVGLQITPIGNEITTLSEFEGVIVVFTKETGHAIYGNTNRTDLSSDLFYLKDLNIHTGIANPNTAVRVVNYLYFLGNDGKVYSLYTPQTDTSKLMTRVLSEKIDIFEEPLARSTTDYTNACAVYFDGNYWLSLGDLVLVYSYLKQGWTVYDSLNATSFTIKDYTLLIGNDSGRVVKYNESLYNDLGSAISTYWKSKRFAMGYPSRLKKFKKMFAIAHTFDDIDSTVKLQFEVDYENIETIYDIVNALSRFGTAVFGDKFTTRNINRSLQININKRGRLISFIFANDAIDESLKIYEINGQYELRGFR